MQAFAESNIKIVVSAYFENPNMAKNVEFPESKISPSPSQKSVQVCWAT